ncbi:MAG: hypothetical protein D6744_15410, partial [Planctomycetota bacterium]
MRAGGANGRLAGGRRRAADVRLRLSRPANRAERDAVGRGQRVRKTVETFDGSGWSISADRVFVWYNWLMLDELDITASGGVW